MSAFPIEMNTEYHSAHRFPAWMALTIFSAVCLAAIASDTVHRDAAEKWTLAVTCLSMILSFLAVCAYLFMRGPFVGQIPEAAILITLTALWAAGLPVAMNPENGIAVVSQQGEGLVINNANLYFFAWLSLAAILYLSGSLAQESAGVDVTQTPPQLARWYGLTASSMVVMGSASRALNSSTCDLASFRGLQYCRRTKFAIAVGTISFVLSAVVTFLVHQTATLQLWVETAFTTVLLTLWCFGVGYITFGSTPGATISNLYFATWISFIMVVFLFAQNFRETIAAREQAHSSTSGTTTTAAGGEEEGHQGGNAAGNSPNYTEDDI
jgi:hypothetical protein